MARGLNKETCQGCGGEYEIDDKHCALTLCDCQQAEQDQREAEELEWQQYTDRKEWLQRLEELESNG